MALLLEAIVVVNNTEVETLVGDVVDVNKDVTLKCIQEAQASLYVVKRSIPIDELLAKK